MTRLTMANPHPISAGNIGWRLAMLKNQFNKGRTNRIRCRATKRDGTPCGMLAMTRYKLLVCSAHGGEAAVARMERRKAILNVPKAKPGRRWRTRKWL